jgi:hypothetical protein
MISDAGPGLRSMEGDGVSVVIYNTIWTQIQSTIDREELILLNFL